MSHIDPNHPRATSLRIREQLVEGVYNGITSTAGLIAHGRGEAFDYLLGEKTHSFALEAISMAASLLLCSKKPVLSVNGNTAALVPHELGILANLLNCHVEVNLFHYSKERVKAIETYLKPFVGSHLLTANESDQITLPGIASDRKLVLQQGIATSDTVFVPLEDGDRCQALINMGKHVVTIDLNPWSRTARSATVTIVDNISRALPLLCETIQQTTKDSPATPADIVRHYDNNQILSHARDTIRSIVIP